MIEDEAPSTGRVGRGVVLMSFEELPDLLTVAEAAKYLRIGLNTAYGLTRQWRLSGGRFGLGYVEVGRSQRIPKAELARFVERGGTAATA